MWQQLEMLPLEHAANLQRELAAQKTALQADFNSGERARQEEYRRAAGELESVLAEKDRQCALAIRAVKREQQKDKRAAEEAAKALKVHEMVVRIQRTKSQDRRRKAKEQSKKQHGGQGQEQGGRG